MRLPVCLAASVMLTACGSSGSSGSARVAAPTSAVAPTSSPAPATPSPTPSETGTAGGLPSFTARAVSRVDSLHAWAVGTVFCDGEPCAEVRRTSDGGATWTRVTPPVRTACQEFTGCTAPLVGVAFASVSVGYVWGTTGAGGDGLWSTTDGGRTWTPQDLPEGGLGYVQTGQGPVLRLSGGTAACGCYPVLQRSDPGSRTWTDVDVSTSPGGVVALARGGPVVVLVTGRNAYAAGSYVQRVVSVSRDGGRTFDDSADPCERGTAESPTETLAVDALVDPAGDVAFVCYDRGTTDPERLLVSRDRGRTFGPFTTLPDDFDGYLAFFDAQHLVIGTNEDPTGDGVQTGTLRASSDGGRTSVEAVHDKTVRSFYGSSDVATATSGLWLPEAYAFFTTTDAGRTWTRRTFDTPAA